MELVRNAKKKYRKDIQKVHKKEEIPEIQKKNGTNVEEEEDRETIEE
ncbi:19437_t:CDS:2 [Entrophospora sp. SA101]|nr:19437_t:CDS:2 [Entrophospora sp. SA101]